MDTYRSEIIEDSRCGRRGLRSIVKTLLLHTLYREIMLKFNQLSLKETSSRGTGGERPDVV